MSAKRILLVTGPPGIGKTTLVMRVAESLGSRGISVGGMTTREVRQGGARVGFEILDLSTGERGWLARAGTGPGPRVGRYALDTATLERIGAAAISAAAARSDVVAIDEVGPMELLSGGFRQAVAEAVGSGKPVIATVHFRSADPLVQSLRGREDAQTFVVTMENRSSLPGEILLILLDLIRRGAGGAAPSPT